ncbi:MULTISPECIES: excalibur calcium-binding domain-containing protein [Methylomonas]|uniref:excalibur calcium-binding domain-containing protein n=1 Tax=Methylomonas TaxID=416 RepID=UPI0009EE96A7|nr:excalibur calcium-binding domain-containing protein [Methylomonas koyamae]NJA04368.1 DUF4124 domain-containing protein [Methylococcaceae bacterium WWC4]
MKKFLCLFILLYSVDSLAGVYKCTDAKGHVVYSDTACDHKADRKIPDLKPLAEVKAEQPLSSKLTDKVKGLFESAPKPEPNNATASSTERNAQNFVCDGRVYCSQMRSCEEATYFINHCPDTKMDGDNDGIPCESQWCQ